ncbi:MAG TPA: hypothetical protein VKV26_24415 [Dehalococcoidia bacterium]|nr:hypothetical protein [Dehalococcoidia bacterium]
MAGAVRLLCLIGVALLAGTLDAGLAAGAPAQPAPFAAALACDAHNPAISFPLQGDGADTPLLPAPSGPNAALDTGLPRMAVLCQAVLQAPASGAAFSLPAGSVSFSVSGPGLIVESAAQLATLPCGSAAQGIACTGAATSGDAAVTGLPGLAVHIVLLSRAALPPLPAPGAISVQARYAEDPSLGDASATAQAAIDLAPPSYALLASADQPLISSGPNAGVVITARLRHALPENCAALGDGPYLFCRGESLQPGDAGAEAGTVRFSTDLGVFANGESAIDADCGAGAGAPPLVAPAPGFDALVPYDCNGANVRLSAAGFAGEATISAAFTGAVTGATAQATLSVTIAPRPATLPLAGGCTAVLAPAGLPSHAPVTDLVGSISPAGAVVAIWRQDTSSGGWLALYLRGGRAPVDDATVEPGQAISVCVDALAQYPLG